MTQNKAWLLQKFSLQERVPFFHLGVNLIKLYLWLSTLFFKRIMTWINFVNTATPFNERTHFTCQPCLHYITVTDESCKVVSDTCKTCYYKSPYKQLKNLTKGNIFAFETVIVSYEEKRTHREFVQTNNANVIDKGKFRVRYTSESWLTAITNEAGNNSKPFPKQYPIDLNDNICSLFYFFYNFITFVYFAYIIPFALLRYRL